MTDISEAEFLLGIDEIALFNKLGKWKFQMDNYGYYNPDLILKMDFEEMGRSSYETYLKQVKEKICNFWMNYKDSELFEDSKDIYYFIIGLLFASNVPYYAATFISNFTKTRSQFHL